MNIPRIQITCPGDKGRGHESRTANVVRFEFGTETEGTERFWSGWHTMRAPSRAQRFEKRFSRSLKLDSWWDDDETEEAEVESRRRELTDDGEIKWDKDLKGVYTCPLCRDNLQVSDWGKLCRVLDRLRENSVETVTLSNLKMVYETCGG
jgi:hypothetical protein